MMVYSTLNGNVVMPQGGLRSLTLINLLTAPPGHIPAVCLMLYCMKYENSTREMTSQVFANIK